MRAMVQCRPDLPMACRTLRHGTVVPADVRVVCLWTAFGLALTGLLFAMGFSAEFGQALMAAG
jgi:hypothetical protein